ncbi:WavE lipopolysaccharide synthesis family protein [Vibrio parahaemolyticus]|uniref:WavE lipopolysaccharide synthesis family protein n=4 Tax=Vibrio parahaemolyticus TaxID=670 RepID=UPI0009A80AA0|nr:WavE lipopolysaccharide synthesis family protein [Vibrio parahaemolyticus]MCS0033922.1 WavE lipopolysaccharide synthesis family protein [Vibrio parahaemolyticus]
MNTLSLRRMFKLFIGKLLELCPNINKSLIERFFFYYNQKSHQANDYVSVHFRPVKHENIYSGYKNCSTKSAILVQGPVDNVDFLLNTLELYKKQFNSARIVLSTWSDTDKKIISKIEEIGIDVVLSDKPDNPGLLNVNYQLVSTKAGLRFISDREVEYTLKTRTDCRIHSSITLDLCEELLRIYKPVDKKQTSRIVLINFNTTKYRPFSFSDIFQYSKTSELNKYWSCPEDNRNNDLNEIKKKNIYNFKFAAENYITESYFGRYYIRNIGEDDSVSLSVSLTHIRDRFIVIDKEMIDHYWNKYNAYEYNVSESPMYSKDRTVEKISFSEWLIMQSRALPRLDNQYLYVERK